MKHQAGHTKDAWTAQTEYLTLKQPYEVFYSYIFITHNLSHHVLQLCVWSILLAKLYLLDFVLLSLFLAWTPAIDASLLCFLCRITYIYICWFLNVFLSLNCFIYPSFFSDLATVLYNGHRRHCVQYHNNSAGAQIQKMDHRAFRAPGQS